MNNAYEDYRGIVEQLIMDVVKKPFEVDTDFRELGMDSFKTISLIAALEKRLGIIINDDDLIISNFSSCNSIIALLESNYISTITKTM